MVNCVRRPGHGRRFQGWASTRRLAILLIGIVILSHVTGTSVRADTEVSVGNDVKVEKLRVIGAPAGGSARVRLLIVNDGQVSLHLRGISSDVGEGSRIDTRIGGDRYVELDVVTVLPKETLDFETDHQRLFLSRLKQNLVPGQELEIRLHFLEGDLNVITHVH